MDIKLSFCIRALLEMLHAHGHYGQQHLHHKQRWESKMNAQQVYKEKSDLYIITYRQTNQKR